MQKELKDKFPQWCEDKETKFELMVSDDIDALMCYTMQHMNYDREWEYFVNSSKDRAYKGYYGEKTGKQYFYMSESATNNINNALVLDFSVNKDVKAWDNHVVRITDKDYYNKLSANANIDITKNNYSSKFCISSFITMLSYYDVEVNKWSYEEKICLCAIDGLYQPFLNPRFISTGEKNLKLLGMDYLIPFIKENIREIKSFDTTYLKNKSIWVNKEGYLETNLNLNKLSDIWGCNIELPKKKFKLYKTIESRVFDTCYNKEQLEKKYGKIFNIALTYGRSGVISYT